MVTLSSTDALLAALRGAQDISVTAYLLQPGRVLDALTAAAQRGAHVRVRLEGYIYKDTAGIAAENAGVVAGLQAAGADAVLVHLDSDARDPMLHAKTVVADDTLFLDDRNFPDDGADTILADSFAPDVRAARDGALGQEDAPNWYFSMEKRPSLASEARLIASCDTTEDLVVESESFGADNAVYRAIDMGAKAGLRPRVLVNARALEGNARESQAIAHLVADGAAVRATDAAEKFTLAGLRGWIGSSNATIAFQHPDQLDWGMRSDDQALVAVLRRRFEARWEAAMPVT